MDVLIFKPHLKVNQYSKDEARNDKRKQNTLRCKQARDTSVKDKRRIPQTLELSNESLHVAQEFERPARKVMSSRIDMLKEWKLQKEKQKASSKPQKARFVVKHVVHKDNVLFNKTNIKDKKEDMIQSGKKNEPTIKLHTKKTKVLQERSVNSEVNHISQKQSYLVWKKSQEPFMMKNPLDKVNKPCAISNLYNKKNTKKQCERKIQQENKLNPTEKITRNLRNKRNEKMDEKQAGTSENCQQKTMSIDDAVSKICDQTFLVEGDIEKTECIDTKNVIYDEEVESIVETLVGKPTAFEPPKGLAFINFKFDLDALSPGKFLEPVVENKNYMSQEQSQSTKHLEGVNLTPECKKKHPKVDSLRRSSRLTQTKNNLADNMETPKTPLALFKKREGITPVKSSITTPTQTASAKRNSLTPNPKNFLSKLEDPVAQRIQSPKILVADLLKTPPDLSKSVKHFTALVSIEEEKFKACCEKWNKVLEENRAPEAAHGNILSAIGQAQLFIRKRFKQFKELIELHKDVTAEKAAHASDLYGFWEMIYFQVKDVHKRFLELENLQNNNWEETIGKDVVKPVVKAKRIAPVKKTAPRKVSTKKSDFKKFRHQMKARIMTEQQDDSSGAFISVLTPAVDEEGKKVFTPVRRSLRNFSSTTVKNSPGVCMVIPADVLVKKAVGQNAVSNLTDEFSADSLEENSPEKQIKAHQTIPEENIDTEITKPLRRSTRKTPSKYRTSDSICTDRKPEDVACNLFAEETEYVFSENESQDFGKYLSKTIISEDQLVKRDLLSSFDEPVSTSQTNSIPASDLMMFSPIVTKNEKVRTAPVEDSQRLPPSSIIDDLLL